MSTIRWSPVSSIKADGSPGTIICGMPGSGKACWDYEKIITPTGIKLIKDIVVGDYVYGQNGKPTRVIGVFPQGKLPLYKVTLLDGRSMVCSEDHLFTVGYPTHNKEIYNVMSVRDLLESGLKKKSKAKYFLKNNECIVFPQKQYTIHPYVIGAFIGNGCKTTNGRLEFSYASEEVPKKIAKLLSKDLGTPIKCTKSSYQNYTWIFYYKERFVKGGLNRLVHASDFNNKELEVLLNQTYSKDRYIPTEYMYGSEKQRYDLLNGLMDTDGHISIGPRYNVRYSSVSTKLIEQVMELVRGLGNYYVTVHKEYKREHRNAEYEVYIGCDNSRKEKLFSVSYKKQRAKDSQKVDKSNRHRHYDRLQIDSITPLDKEDDCTCFMVNAKDSQFIVGETVVTHNTFFLLNIAATAKGLGQRFIFIDPKNDVKNLYNIYPDISFIDLKDIQPNALNPFTFLQTINKNTGEVEYISDTTITTIIEILCDLTKEEQIAIGPIITDFINKSRRKSFTDMSEVAEYLFERDSKECQSVGTRLKKYYNSSFGQLLFTREKNVKPLILSKTDSLGISLFGMKMPDYRKSIAEYTDEERFTSAILYILTKKLYDILQQDSLIPTVFICDEAHTLFSSPEMTNVIMDFLRLGRSLNVATVLASQGISHFPDDVANYTTSKFLLKSSIDEARKFITMFDTSQLDPTNALDVDSIVSSVTQFEKGQAFMIDRKNRNGIIQIESNYDPKLLSTNPFEKKR